MDEFNQLPAQRIVGENLINIHQSVDGYIEKIEKNKYKLRLNFVKIMIKVCVSQ